MGDGKTPGPMCQAKQPIAVNDGTMCLAPTPAPGPIRSRATAGDVRQVLLRDEDICQSRMISTSSEEFVRNYVDNNIASTDYWSTAVASQDKQYRDFWVNYTDGRQLKFTLDELPIRHQIKQRPGYITVRNAFKPRVYIKRGGFIYPEFCGEGSTPRLIDIATTISFNHRQREKFLEVAELTFQFAVILSAYVTPPEMPEMPRRGVKPFRRMMKPAVTPSDPAARARELVARMEAEGKEVVANIGGAGASHEPPHAININKQVPGTERMGIPNLVQAPAEEIGTLFEPGTVDRVEGYHLAPTFDWQRVAPGAYRVLRSGGKVRIDYRGATSDAARLAKALRDAGFKNIKVISDVVVEAEKL